MSKDKKEHNNSKKLEITIKKIMIYIYIVLILIIPIIGLISMILLITGIIPLSYTILLVICLIIYILSRKPMDNLIDKWEDDISDYEKHDAKNNNKKDSTIKNNNHPQYKPIYDNGGMPNIDDEEFLFLDATDNLDENYLFKE